MRSTCNSKDRSFEVFFNNAKIESSERLRHATIDTTSIWLSYDIS